MGCRPIKHTVYVQWNHHKLKSKVLAIIALLLWIASLFMVGLLYYPSRQVLGIEYLYTGWLGILQLTVAWYANPLFILGVTLVLIGKTVKYIPILAFILSLNVFFYDNTMGEHIMVYAYGWGVVVWLLAMTMLIVASGAVPSSSDQTTKVQQISLRYILGILLSTIVITSSISLSNSDHNQANSQESKILDGLAI